MAIVTYYFRRSFVLSSTNGLSLIASNLFDDGAVVYINGREAWRTRMPSGTVSNETHAMNAGDLSFVGRDIRAISIDFVKPGTNVIAVEVHQGRTNSTDIIMGMRLVTVKPDPELPPLITRHPRDLRVDEGHAAQFSVEATGTSPLTFRWYTNGVVVPNQNTSTLILSSTPRLIDGVVYSVSVSNRLGVLTSSMPYCESIQM